MNPTTFVRPHCMAALNCCFRLVGSCQLEKAFYGIEMKSKMPRPPLAKGQIWKIDNAYIQIVELGKTLIQYKMLRQQGQKAVKTHMTGIGTLETYLKTNAARLVDGL